VVTACQRVGIRSQVQRLSRPHRGGDRLRRRRRRGQRPGEVGANGDAAAIGANGSEAVAEAAEAEAPTSNGSGQPEPAPIDSATKLE